MSKRFYIAARKDRSVQADALSEQLRSKGWERTFVWSGQDANDVTSYPSLATAELDGVRSADVLIVLLPGGFGTHVEIGAALALGKPVVIHAPDQRTLETPYPCVFHHHPGVRLIVSESLDVEDIVADVDA
jgi:nucleoside 2-deoxyribosyltransferase